MKKSASLLSEAEKKFDPENPSGILPALLEAYSEMEKHPDNYWITEKKKELQEVIRSAAGLWIEAIADNYSYSPGSTIKVSAGIVNRSDFPFKLKEIKISYLENDSTFKSGSY